MINFKTVTILRAFLCFTLSLVMSNSVAQQATKISPGVWKIVYGEQEAIKPSDFKAKEMADAMGKLPAGNDVPLVLKGIKFSQMSSGVLAELGMEDNERFYGFGLQVNTFEQRGLRREIRTNSQTIGNLGFSHAPMPFYISSKGYGVLVNSSRYVNFYMGSQHKLAEATAGKETAKANEPGSSPEELYRNKNRSSSNVEIQIKGAKGMEILVFEGPTMRNVMERYNLYSGGGALPPMWGLGFKYRAKNTFTQAEVLDFSKYFRDNHIPCDMFGLEPGWQTAAYSCSYVWNKDKYPTPDSLISIMNGRGYKLNLWEHAYTHPTSPIFSAIAPFSGNYKVWNGAVPDFTLPKARAIFGDYHNNTFIKKGILSFKLDECDAAYYDDGSGEWSFPDIARFPSGMDGEQMRQSFGLLYQKTLLDEYRKENIRSMMEVRASHLFASPYNAAIYTDMYDHGDFVKMIINSGFSGTNWSPEVRDIRSEEDLIRRLQTSAMSAHMNVNCWFLKNLPWYQFERDKNNKDILLPNAKEIEQKVKKLIETRMSLIPYLYAAFADYHYKGIPPFRAMVMDYPDDKETFKLDNQYMMGESIMCAPFINGASTRDVYFPAGNWYDFNSGKKYAGAQKHKITMSLTEMPMFVKEGTILPLAKPIEFVSPTTVFDITCKVYGNAEVKPVHLFEDDSNNFGYEANKFAWLNLNWKNGKGSTTRDGKQVKKLYNISSWSKVE
ncbi:TIM-barrel domain-containing protein [Mucilaginibacter myungsuensis]|uniref:Glycosyl hydrolase family 31 n=1 Tax=Mucilaginibacter myungsuensis TaxID=649104 RepID=A0A929PXM5_9SPHI|nr:TIM-barrel domain-containing protein [Mucilaginibacter myungsuensis]MBE9662555.1 glycosyl hydrolase family 31 [Mucilaginibacter myungsuensis]MDN3597975.1 glycoside hydrolase family 31 protein [Mucilaginibacter myungsuensis]